MRKQFIGRRSPLSAVRGCNAISPVADKRWLFTGSRRNQLPAVRWICSIAPVRLRWITYLLSTNLARPVPNLFKLYVLTKTDLRIRIGDRVEILYNEIDSTAPAVGQLAPNILIPLVQNGN